MTELASQSLRLRVEGMDCGSCALKIETGLKRLPGVRDISVNFGLGSLPLAFAVDRTSRDAIEGRIRALGYVAVLVDGAAAVRPSPAARPAAGPPWSRNRPERRGFGTGDRQRAV